MDATRSERQLAEAQADLFETNNLFGHSPHFNNLLLNFTMQEGSEEGATINYDIVQIDRSRRIKKILNKLLEYMLHVVQSNCAYMLTNFSF